MAYHGHEYCQLSQGKDVDVPLGNTSWSQVPFVGVPTCSTSIARGRLYSDDKIFAHFSQCGEVQTLMADYAAQLPSGRPLVEEMQNVSRLSIDSSNDQTTVL